MTVHEIRGVKKVEKCPKCGHAILVYPTGSVYESTITYGCPKCANDELRTMRAQSVHLQVLEFHRVVGQPIVEKPAIPSDERIRLRARLVAEEAIEFLDALFEQHAVHGLIRDKIAWLVDYGVVKVDLPKAIDALGDIDYVVEGSRIEFGTDGGPVAVAIHDANMAKQNGPTRPDGKRLKPEGWKPPDIEGELKHQGWTP